ncbi:MAG: FecR family protein [Opitutaceae bacterium]
MIRILLAYLLAIISLQASITGAWYVKGYKTSATPSSLSPMVAFSGTATLSNSSVSFSTDTYTDSYSVSFAQSGDTYLFEGTISPTNDSVFEVFQIKQIDDDTLIYIHSNFDTEFAVGEWNIWDYFSYYQGVIAVFSRNPFPDNTAEFWTGDYDVETLETEMELGSQPERGGYSHKAALSRSDSTYSLIAPNIDYEPFRFSLSGGVLSDTSIETNREKLESLSDQNADIYLIEERETWRVIQLQDGRLVAFETDLSRQAVEPRPRVKLDPGCVEDCSYTAPPEEHDRVGECFMAVHFLEAPLAGRVKLVRGEATVIRKGKKLTLTADDMIYEGDVIKTGPRSFVRIVFTDRGSMNIGPKSELTIEKFKYQPAGLVNILTGKIRGQVHVETGRIDKDRTKLFVKTENTCFGVRGTIYTAEYTEDNGMGISTVEVEEGIVELINLISNEVTELNAGESGSLSIPLPTATFTLNFPSGIGGSFRVNGAEINSFPHVVSMTIGDELQLEALRAPGYVFSGWTGDLESVDSSYITYLDEDMVVSGDFETYDPVGGTYTDYWADSDYSILAQMPEADANGDGIKNVIAYGLGFPPAGAISPSERGYLPLTTPSAIGNQTAVTMLLPETAPEDVSYFIEVSEVLDSGDLDWIEIAFKEGDGDWEGPEAENISEGPETDDYYPVTFEFPEDYDTNQNGFLRIRMEVGELD